MTEFFPWSSPSLSGNNLMESLQQTLPVRLIATPRKDFHMCRRDECLEDVVTRNVEKFDHFPVTQREQTGKEQIVGLIELARYEKGEVPAGTVGDYMGPLSEGNVIGAETGILTFVKSADSQPCRLLVTAERIEGLVSISDLQQLPVRAALFALITHAEMTMADVIRREFNNSGGWVHRIPEKPRANFEKRLEKAKKANNQVDPLHMTLFPDKISIIFASPYFADRKESFKSDLTELQNLRNNLAHANEYAADRKSAKSLSALVRKAEWWIQQMNTVRSKSEAG
jgi:hypothetical protein